MTQPMKTGYPKTAVILAITGSALIMLNGMLLFVVGTFILPNVNFANVHAPPQIPQGNLPSLVGGIVRGIGAFGLICGVVVLVSAILLIAVPTQRVTWGVLILVFSVLSFLGFGGFIIGAILGIVGGVLALRWKLAAVQGQP